MPCARRDPDIAMRWLAVYEAMRAYNSWLLSKMYTLGIEAVNSDTYAKWEALRVFADRAWPSLRAFEHHAFEEAFRT